MLSPYLLSRWLELLQALVAELDNAPSPVVLVDLADLPVSMLVDGVHLTRDGYRELAVRVARAMAGDRVRASDALPDVIDAVLPPAKSRRPRGKSTARSVAVHP